MDGLAVWVFVGVVVIIGGIFVGAMQAAADRALLHRERMAETRASVARAVYTPQYPMLHTLNTPYTEVERQRVPLPAPPVVLDVPAPQLPGVTTLGQVTGYRPSRERILLGLGPGGALITVSIAELLHLLIVGRTGGGKSVIERLVMTCLGALPDVELHWWNPHYTPLDPDTGDRWDLIAARCVGGRALTDEGEILAALERMATVELPARKTRYRAGQHPGPPRFYVIDEAPVLAAADKRFMPWLGVILREGRKFGLYIIMATQDALISTLGGSSGLRAQAQTVYYVGGDSYSAKALLGFVPPDPEGRGICHLKSTATPGAPLIRVPRPTNADVEAWLGPLVATEMATPVATSGYGPGYTLATDNVIDLQARVAKVTPTVADVAISADAQAALALFLAGKSMADVVLELRGIASNQGGKYQAALTEITELVRQAMKAKGA